MHQTDNSPQQTALARAVKRSGLKQRHIAESLSPKVDPSTFTRWLKGTREVPAARLAEIAAFLGVPESELRDEAVTAGAR